MRRIEITEAVLKVPGGPFYQGDIKSFPDDVAAEYIRLGWARDVETGEQGERKPGAQKLLVDNVVTSAG